MTGIAWHLAGATEAVTRNPPVPTKVAPQPASLGGATGAASAVAPLKPPVKLRAPLVQPPVAQLPLAQPPVATPAPQPERRIIRVGLSTRGAPIAFWSPAALTITDTAQPGRRLVVPAGARVAFAVDLPVAITEGAQRWSGAIQVQLDGKVSRAWKSVLVTPASTATRISTNGSNPRWERAYRGSFEIAGQNFSFEPDTHRGGLRLVNIVALEDYLKGVVPWEMTPSAPLEALKAQAICARSETLAKINGGRHSADGYDICDYDHCQGYSGTENEKPSSSRAVEQTAGLAIFYRGRVADAVYGTNSGGITASSADVWRGPAKPYLRGVRDYSLARHNAAAHLVKDNMSEDDWVRYCTQNVATYAQPSSAQTRELAARRLASPRAAALFQADDLPEFYRWTRVVTPHSLAQAMSRWIKIDTVTEMRVLDRAESGHIKRLLVRGAARGEEATWTFEGDSQIRAILSGRLGSTTALPSSTFVVLPQRDAKGVVTAFVLKGAGWGHGVGMCQRGAQNHAREGWTARQIIQFYFRDVELRKVD